MEQWKTVTGFEGLYQISNTGKVKSTKYKNHKLIGSKSMKLRNTVCLYKNPISFRNYTRHIFFIDELVAVEFLDYSIEDENLYLIHLDGDYQNDNLSNLKVLNQSLIQLSKIKTKSEIVIIKETEEIWKDIIGYEDLYQISNLGQVKSFRKKEPYNLSLSSINNSGYISINLSVNGKMKRFYVHRLVAQHFVDNPNNYTEVDHFSNCKTQNEASNLRWVSRNHNLERGSANPIVSLNLITGDKTFFKTQVDAAEHFNVSTRDIDFARKNKNRKRRMNSILDHIRFYDADVDNVRAMIDNHYNN